MALFRLQDRYAVPLRPRWARLWLARPGVGTSRGWAGPGAGIDNGDPQAAGMVAECALAAGNWAGLGARPGQAREPAKGSNINPEFGVGRVRNIDPEFGVGREPNMAPGSPGCSTMGGISGRDRLWLGQAGRRDQQW
jgi:hypothetical protein